MPDEFPMPDPVKPFTVTLVCATEIVAASISNLLIFTLLQLVRFAEMLISSPGAPVMGLRVTVLVHEALVIGIVAANAGDTTSELAIAASAMATRATVRRSEPNYG